MQNEFIGTLLLKTNSGWKHVKDISSGDKLLMMKKLNHVVGYANVLSNTQHTNTYHIDIFKFRSKYLDIDMPVKFKSDFILGCKPTSYHVLRKQVDLSLKAHYNKLTTLTDLMELPLDTKPDGRKILTGLYLVCGRQPENSNDTVEYAFSSIKDIEWFNKVINIIVKLDYRYSIEKINNNTVLVVNSLTLVRDIDLVYNDIVKGRKLSLSSGATTSRKFRLCILKGMLIYSKILGTFGRFDLTDRVLTDLIQELYICVENRITQVEKKGMFYIIDYGSQINDDIVIKKDEYSVGYTSESTYSIAIEDKNRYAMVLALDRNGRAFWLNF